MCCTKNDYISEALKKYSRIKSCKAPKSKHFKSIVTKLMNFFNYKKCSFEGE